jgi:N6-L-threonylcarbamoyladenine synthase
MLSLGIESTAHTFSCAVLEKKGKKGKIFSDVRKIYRPPEGEGIHPREASRHHIESSAQVLSDCLAEAKVKINDLDLIAYAAGPGLGPCLRVGAVVNPLVLLVSGGHTMLLAFMMNKWRVFGETLDITLGQLLDQFGRAAGFASPCGKQIEILASKTTNYFPLPYSVKGNDVSFSGLLSAAKSLIPKGLDDACFSLQETAFAMIAEATERALSFTKKKELLVVGGVAANKRLSEMLKSVCKRQNCKFFVTPLKFSGDCGSQIAWTGLLESQTKKSSNIENTFVKQSWRLDTVQVDY